ncbi:hypothetical protein [Streptomyces sp. NPDC051286]|uniref:hypothetical protein n=1 Tax=Streptomyces sp. NPDC051286 TaxID=3365647 RepID=UPI003789E373
MQIDSASIDGGYGPGPTGSVTGGLKSKKAAWVAAGEGVADQRKRLSKALTALAAGQKGIGANAGCQTAEAQRTVHTSWNTYAKTLGEKCEDLQKILDKVGHDLLLTDESVKDELSNLRTKYQDAPAMGGHEGR